LIIDDTLPQQTGPVKCVAKNCAGEATCQAMLTVRGRAPTFIEKPIKCTVMKNQTSIFKAKIDGDPTPKVVWSKGKFMTFKDGGRTKVYYDENIEMYVIEISKIVDKDAGTYTCKISNEHGSDDCSCTLIVTDDESLVTDWQDQLKKT
jgi:hypothetical protein